MSFPLNGVLVQLFRATRDLPTPVAQALDAWRALPTPAADTPLERTRLVVLNVETVGFDARRAVLRALGAVAIEDGRTISKNVFAAALSVPPHDEAPPASDMPAEALGALLGFIGKAPIVAFHAAVAQTVLERVLRAELGVTLTNPWIDLAPLARALAPQAQLPYPGLDNWLRHFGLPALVRDHALDDARVTAELFQILLQRATARGVASLAQLNAVARTQQRTATGVG